MGNLNTWEISFCLILGDFALICPRLSKRNLRNCIVIAINLKEENFFRKIVKQ